MWNPAGEIPQVVFLHISDKTLAVFINGRDPRGPVEHKRPFVRRMPVQFTNAPGCESHVYPCQGFRDGQFPNGHLARPSPFVSPLVRKRERIFERLHQALGIGSGWPLGICIRRVQRRILRARVALASVLFLIPLLLPACSACRENAARRKRRRSYADESPASQYLFLCIILCLYLCAFAHTSYLSDSSWFPSQHSKSDLIFDDSMK